MIKIGFRGGRNNVLALYVPFVDEIGRIAHLYETAEAEGQEPPPRNVEDWDIVSAYTSCMGLIGIPDMALVIDITHENLAKCIEDSIACKGGGFLQAYFRFNEGTTLPSLPVTVDSDNLAFPMEGTTCTTLQEWKVALDNGAIIIGDVEGWYAPYVKDEEGLVIKPFRPFFSSSLFRLDVSDLAF